MLASDKPAQLMLLRVTTPLKEQEPYKANATDTKIIVTSYAATSSIGRPAAHRGQSSGSQGS